MRPSRLVALAAVLGLALPASLTPGSSAAGPAGPESRGQPGTWTKVTTGKISNTAEPGLYRTTPDQVLHVVYLREGESSDELAFTTVGPMGSVDTTGVAIGGWAALPPDPKIVGTPGGGMRLVFGGIQDASGTGAYDTGQMFSATADPAGTTWTLEPGALTESHYGLSSYGTGATTLADGTPVVSFPANSTLTWNSGGTDATYTVDSCCIYDSTLARDGDEVWVAYAGNGDTAATAGIFAKRLLPTVGDTIKALGSSVRSNVLTPGQSTAFVARPGGGLYAAYCLGYPTCDAVGLWKVGEEEPALVPGTKGARDIALSTGPGGRLWVAWTTYDRVKVVHTSPSGLTFGAVRTVRPPAAADSLYGVFLAGADGHTDVLVNDGSAIYEQIVLAGLSLKAWPRKWRHGTRQKVLFTVTDAGAEVGDARVTAGGKSCTTRTDSGQCSITFGPSGPRRFTATAHADGYADGRVRLRVR